MIIYWTVDNMYEKLYNEISLLPTSVSDSNFELSTKIKGGWSPHVLMKTEYHSLYSLFPLRIDVSKRQLLCIINFLCTSKYEIVSEKKMEKERNSEAYLFKGMCSNGPLVGMVPHKSLFETSLKQKGTSHHKPITWHGTKLQPELYIHLKAKCTNYTTVKLYKDLHNFKACNSSKFSWDWSI